MKSISRRLFAVVLAPTLFLSACGKKESKAPESVGAGQVAAPAAAGPFTGVLTMKTTIPKAGTSDMTLSIGPKGMRAESKTSIGGHNGPMSMTVLSLTDKPGKVYMINGETGACMELDVSKVNQQGAGDPYKDAKIENLGKERVNGFDCNHVRLSWAGRDTVLELWVSKDILDYFAYAKMQGSDDQTNTQLAEKLKASGLDGFPVKSLLSPSGVVTELVKVERTAPDDKLFEIPANAAKVEVPAMPSGPHGMSKEKIKEMQEYGRKMQQQMGK